MIALKPGVLNPFLEGNMIPRHTVMLPAETFEMRKRLLTLSLAKPRQNIEAILKSYKLIIYGDIHYITNSFCKTVLK